MNIQGMEVPRMDASLPPVTERQRKCFIAMDTYNQRTWASQYSHSPIMNHLTRGAVQDHSGIISKSTRLHTWVVRPPTQLESLSAISMASRLEALEVEGQSQVQSWAQLPPGRMSFSRDKANRLQRAAGQVPTNKVFERNRIRHAPKTQIKVGIVLDISASMGSHAALGASIAWVLAEATQRVGGLVAVAASSNGSWPIVAPGERQGGVVAVGTSAGGHQMAGGMFALDGALNLIDGDGARLLVVFSDGMFDLEQSKPLPLMGEAGVQTLWISPPMLDKAEFMRPRQFFSHCEVEKDQSYTDVLDSVARSIEDAVRRDKGLDGATY